MGDANFEWDDDKNAANYAKHGVSFEQARLSRLQLENMTTGPTTAKTALSLSAWPMMF